MAGLNGAPREDGKLRSSFTIINEWLMSMNDNKVLVSPCVLIEVCHDLLVSHLIRTASPLIEQHWKDSKDFGSAMRHYENPSLPKLLSDIRPK